MSLSLALPTACRTGARNGGAEVEHIGPVQHTSKEYRRVVLIRPGDQTTDKHLGYVGHTEVSVRGVRTKASYVYDRKFRPIGFFFDDGATYKFIDSDDGSYTFIGNLSVNRALELLFETEGTFDHERAL